MNIEAPKNTPNVLAELEGLSQAELMLKRAELVAKPKAGIPLTTPELELLVQIYGQLRRRSSGPPSAKKGKAGPKNETLSDINI